MADRTELIEELMEQGYSREEAALIVGIVGTGGATVLTRQDEFERLLAVSDTLVAIAENPVGFVEGAIVSIVLGLWGALLNYIELVWRAIADSVGESMTPINEALARFSEGVIGFYAGIGDMAVHAGATVGGPFAPFVVAGIWFVTVLSTILIVGVYIQIALGLAETYLPLESVPGYTLVRGLIP